MLSETKKRKVKMWTLMGAISGAILAAILYIFAGQMPMYLIFIPATAAMAGGQAYLSPE